MPDTKPKIVIIGMGYLMEYLLPCYSLLLKGGGWGNVLATTMDASTLEVKQERLPFRVQLGGNLEALTEMRPDIILFAPPPDAVPQIIRDELMPYFTICRANGWPLPEIYAFPPAPHAGYYLDAFGGDTLAVNIVPKTESGKIGEELTMLSFAGGAVWPCGSRARLLEFCSPMGGVEELSATEFYSQLGCRCVANIMPWVFFTAQDCLAAKGACITHRQMALFVKSALMGQHDEGGLPAPLCDMLVKITALLGQNVSDYLASQGFAVERALKITGFKLAADMDLCIGNPRMQIVRQIKCYATKGGISEIVMLNYGTMLEERMSRLFSAWPDIIEDEDFALWFRQRIFAMCRNAAHRAATLHQPLPVPEFAARHVEDMRRLITDAALEHGGPDAQNTAVRAMASATLAGDRARQVCTLYYSAQKALAQAVDIDTAGDIISEARLGFGRLYGQAAAYLPIQRQSEFI